MLEKNAGQAIGRRPGVVVHERQAADLSQHFAEKRIEFLVVGQQQKNFPRRPRDQKRRPTIAIGMAEDRDIAPERQPHAFADFFPDIRGSDRALGKDRATGVGFRLKTKHPPDVAALWIGEIPANHFRHVVDITAGEGGTEGGFLWPTGPLSPHPPPKRGSRPPPGRDRPWPYHTRRLTRSAALR